MKQTPKQFFASPAGKLTLAIVAMVLCWTVLIVYLSNTSAGDPVLLNKLYDLSLALPDDALVTSFRFTDGNCDLAIQTQNRNIDLSQRMHFSYWKIGRLNQRITDTIVTFTVSLVKTEVQQ